mgnify:FL=1|jgi:hypothetical protein
MDKKAERLRYKYDDSIQFYQLPIDRALFIKFKAQCVKDGVTIKDKVTDMIKSSLGHV